MIHLYVDSYVYYFEVADDDPKAGTESLGY